MPQLACTHSVRRVVLREEVTVSAYRRPVPIVDTRPTAPTGTINAKEIDDECGFGGAASRVPGRHRFGGRPAVTDSPDRHPAEPSTDRRRLFDRRSHLEHAAALASQAVAMRMLSDDGARKLTAIARELELVRTPTAPLIQRQTSLDQILETIEELTAVGEQLRAELATFRRGVLQALAEARKR
jgi:hypothetical protein